MPVFSGNEEDYLEWKMELESYLRLTGIDISVRDEHGRVVTHRPDEGDAEVQAEGLFVEEDLTPELNHRLADKLFIAIGKKKLLYVPYRQDGNRMLAAIEARYEAPSVSREIEIRDKLGRLRLADCADLDGYFSRIQMMCMALAQAGGAATEREQIVYVIRGLPTSYDPVVPGIEDNMTWPHAMQVLTRQAQRLVARAADQRLSAGRHAGTSAGGRVRAPDPGATTVKRCHHCGAAGHIRRDCRRRLRDAPQRGGADATPPVARAHPNAPGHGGGAGRGDAPNRGARAFLTTVRTAFATPSAETASQFLSGDWVLDSGATAHMTPSADVLTDYVPSDGFVRVADGRELSVHGTGSVQLACRAADGRKLCVDIVVLHVPDVVCNLLSVSDLVDDGYEFKLGQAPQLSYADRHVPLTVVSGLWLLRSLPNATCSIALSLLHRRYGHADQSMCARLEQCVTGVELSDKTVCECETCIVTKMRRPSFPKQSYTDRTGTYGCDLVGPFRVVSADGYRYMIVFVGHRARLLIVYGLRNKTETADALRQFLADVPEDVTVLRTDGAPDLAEGEFHHVVTQAGISPQTTARYAPQQNGAAERHIATLVSMTRAMLHDAHMPHMFWSYAMRAAAYLRNRTVQTGQTQTPIEMATGKRPDVSHLRVWGCACYTLIPKGLREGKLGDRAARSVFLGYPADGIKGYLVYLVNSGQIVVSRDVQFSESKPGGEFVADLGADDVDDDWFPVTDMHYDDHEAILSAVPVPDSRSLVHRCLDDGDDGGDGASTVSPLSPAIADESVPDEHGADAMEEEDSGGDDAGAAKAPPVMGIGGECAVRESNIDTATDVSSRRSTRASTAPRQWWVATSLSAVPTSFSQAVRAPDADAWKRAIDTELDNHDRNGTWEELPMASIGGARVISTKWVFSLKRDSEGAVIGHKARMVARGFTQRAGVDYHECYAPVTSTLSFRALCAVAASQSFPVHHVDVSAAYLHAPVEEELYVKLPHRPGFVGRLIKSLYGLHQAARNWYECIDGYLRELSFVPSDADRCVYVASAEVWDGYFVLCVYVDDLAIVYEHQHSLDRFVAALSGRFRITNAPLTLYLGMSVCRRGGDVVIHQQPFIVQLLLDFGMEQCKPVCTPAVAERLEADAEGELCDATLYRTIVGKLLWLQSCTRPDLSFAVHQLCRYSCAPRASHLRAAKRVLRFLAGTSWCAIRYRQGVNVAIEGWSDSDWAGDVATRKSTSGYAFMVAHGALSWRAGLQSCVALSSAEAEYIGLADAAKEAMHLRQLGRQIGINVSGPTVIRGDNRASIAMAHETGSTRRTRHIAARYHYTRERVAERDVDIEWVPSESMVADVMTKPLGLVLKRAHPRPHGGSG